MWLKAEYHPIQISPCKYRPQSRIGIANPQKSFDTSGFATDNLKNERNIAVS